MTSTAERIYEALHGKGYVTASDLARMLGLASDRSLRGHGDYEGLLAQADDEIWREHGLTIITRMENPPGIKLTGDVEEAKAAQEQWHAWGVKILKKAERMDVRIQMMSGGLGI